MDTNQLPLDEGTILTQEHGIQIIVYTLNNKDTVYRYVDTDSQKEVLRTKEESGTGLNSMTAIDKEYWDITIDGVNAGESEIKMDTPYKLHVIAEDRAIHIMTRG
ncbi:MAG: hypothetical protein WD317_02600 [Balneolaceae bacterium]